MNVDASQQLLLLADLFAKSFLVLAVGFACVRLAKKSAAAVRHRIWSLTFLGLLVLPVLSVGLPSVRLDVMPANLLLWPSASDVAYLDITHQPMIDTNADFADVGSVDHALRPADPPRSEPRNATPTQIVVTAEAAAKPPGTFQVFSSVISENWPLFIWHLGFLAVSFPVLFGLLRIACMNMTSRRVDDETVQLQVDRVKAKLGIRTQIRILEGKHGRMPMTWGAVSPVVVLPRDWKEMSQESLEFVLLHELSHIQRRDVLQQLVARFTTAIYWLNPGCWLALRQMRLERELACDDCVLRVHPQAASYAAELVKIARSFQPNWNAAAVGMARPSQLRARVEALLETHRNHHPLQARAARRMAILAVLFITALAVTRIGVHNVIAQTENDSNEAISQLVYRATVQDADGRPVSGAKVYRLFWSRGSWPNSDAEIPAAKTNSDGIFEYKVAFSEELQAWYLQNSHEVYADFCVVTDRHGFANANSTAFETTGKLREFFEKQGKQQRLQSPQRIITLPKPESLRGHIFDIEGQPVSGALVRPTTILSPAESAGNLDAWEAEAQKGRVNFFELRNRLKLKSTLGGSDRLAGIARKAITDDNGYFELKGIGADRIIDLQVTGSGIVASELTARTRSGPTLEFSQGNQTKKCYPNDFRLVASRGGKVNGCVTDAETGNPIVGASVAAGTKYSRFSTGKPWLFTETDKDGNYELDGYSLSGRGHIYVRAPNYLPVASNVELSASSRTQTKDLQLNKGVILRGRVLHQNTGGPLTGVAHYYVAPDNPAIEAMSGFAYSMTDLEAATNDQGEFEMAVPTGDGIVGFVPDVNTSSFSRGLGADKIDVMHDEDRGVRIFHTRPQALLSSNECLLRKVTIRDDEPNEIVLSLTSGQSVMCKLVDADNSPVPGCMVLNGEPDGGLGPYYVKTETAEFKVAGVVPDTEKHLFAFHTERKLGGTTKLVGTDGPPTIKLLPLCSIKGRLADADGKPINAYVNMSVGGGAYAPGMNPTNEMGAVGKPGIVETDADGNFQIDGLLPNFKYGFTAGMDGYVHPIVIDLQLSPGETKDVGSVVPGTPFKN